jgi:mannobiose 2-epimerase
MKRFTIAVLATLALRLSAVAQPAAPSPERYRQLAGELDGALREHVVAAWFPRVIDEAGGGFHAGFTRDWSPKDDAGKSTVFHARMTWIAAQVALKRPDLREEMLPIVRRGVETLQTKLWDRERGGFYWMVDSGGRPIEPSDAKHAYAQAFGIFAAAAAYEATGDTASRDLAIRAFRWFDLHAHDPANGGYFESLALDGTPLPGGDLNAPPLVRHYSFYPGFKTSNAHLHLLEAWTQLYRVWKDDVLRSRLQELLTVVRDRLVVEPGCLHQIAFPDWRPLPDRISFGHDIEAAFLMINAAEAMGNLDAGTSRVAQKLVDHTLAYGWDDRNGGVFDGGSPLQQVRSGDKTWWPQMEALNALLMMHRLHGSKTTRYWNAFERQWQFVSTNFLDGKRGGVHEEVSEDGRRRSGDKGGQWKAAYHDGRAFLFNADALEALAKRAR